MDPVTYLRVAAALALVIVAVLAVGMVLRRFAGSHVAAGRGRRGARLSVVETRMLDGRHRLVLVRHDTREHLILLGPQAPVVVEAGMPAADPVPSDADASDIPSRLTDPGETA